MTTIALLRRMAGKALRIAGVGRARSPARPTSGPTGQSSDPATVDLNSPQALADPVAAYEALRPHGPVVALPRHRAWLVLGHAAMREAMARPDCFSNDPYQDIDHVLLGADPPDHGAVRRVVARQFTPAALARAESAVRALPAALLKARFDVVQGYATPFSRAAAGALLGADDVVLDAIAEAEKSAQAEPEPLFALIAAIDALAERLSIHAVLRDAAPDTLSPADLRVLVRLLWLAAITTTERAIVSAALLLIDEPALRGRLRADSSLTPPFVEELLRLHPPELMLPRRTVRDTELGGVRIPADAQLWLSTLAANRDPAVFPEPHRFRLDRGTNPHLSFGSAIHHCSGTALARRLLPIAIRPLIEAERLRLIQPRETIEYQQNFRSRVPLGVVIGT